jgi:hypothetical protein
MRLLPLAIGVCTVLAIGLSLSGSFRSLAARPTVSVERGALAVPPPLAPESPATASVTRPAQPPTPPTRPATASANRFPLPRNRQSGWLLETNAVPFLPPVMPPPDDVRRAAPASSPPTNAPTPPTATARTIAPAKEPSVEVCAECGVRAERSLTRGRETIWFCAAHSEPPALQTSDSTPPHAEPEIAKTPPRALPKTSAAASTQCTGMTRNGARCRRKTLDGSGRCHQHRVKE